MAIPHVLSFMIFTALLAGPASAEEVTAQIALKRYCEPLVAGMSADRVEAAARADGLKDEIIAGQPMLRIGELMVGISDSPRVCFVQAPTSMTRAQGMALVDQWGKASRGIKSPTKTGPDGSPVTAWTAAGSRSALVGSHQLTPSGLRVMNFIMMPIAAKR